MDKYYNYRKTQQQLDDEEIIFCVDNPEDSRHFGNIQRIFTPTEKTITTPDQLLISYAKEYFGPFNENELTDQDAIDVLLPEDIVDSCGAWDDIDFITFLGDRDWFFCSGHDGIITPDGMVVFAATETNLLATNILEEE